MPRPVLDVEPILQAARDAVHGCRLHVDGAYRRYVLPPRGTHSDAADPNGCADAACILYTLGEFPRYTGERQKFVHTLQSMQCPHSGLYMDGLHHPLHTTAHCIAALELFDSSALYPVQDLEPLTNSERMQRFLEALPWKEDPETAGHQAAAIYAILLLTEDTTAEWGDAFFHWVEDATEERTGFLRRGCVEPKEIGGQLTLLPYAQSFFNILTCYVAARRAHILPFKVLDTCLDMMELNWALFCNQPGYNETVWITCMTRSNRIDTHRSEEVRQSLIHFAVRYVESLNHHLEAEPFNDLHTVFAVVNALSELQISLPGLIGSDKPLRQVLDRRPFV